MSPEFQQPQTLQTPELDMYQEQGRLAAFARQVVGAVTEFGSNVRERALPYIASGAAAFGGGVAVAASAEASPIRDGALAVASANPKHTYMWMLKHCDDRVFVSPYGQKKRAKTPEVTLYIRGVNTVTAAGEQYRSPRFLFNFHNGATFCGLAGHKAQSSADALAGKHNPVVTLTPTKLTKRRGEYTDYGGTKGHENEAQLDDIYVFVNKKNQKATIVKNKK